jgi:hypothetical protein
MFTFGDEGKRFFFCPVLRNYSIGEYRITSVRQSTIGHGMIGE